jgi:hypothetical protein
MSLAARERHYAALHELHVRQMRIEWHHVGMHRLERCLGYPYCFPDGPNGDYMTPPATYGEILRGASAELNGEDRNAS